MSKIVLSKRLKAIAEMVTAGHRICDIGCDHAHIAIYLVGQGIAPKAIAMDIHTGPLARASEHIKESGLIDKIETRLSDGFSALKAGEAETVIIAGMGGRLMEAILVNAGEKTAALQELILAPQSEVPAFRRFLRINGFQTVQEELIFEENKFYPIIKVIPTPGRLPIEKLNETKATIIADCYGQIPLNERNPVLLKYLKREHKITLEIIGKINNTCYLNKKNQEKLAEIKKREAELSDLIRLWQNCSAD
ncbi:MAG: class I SAM-dependent methyltransferase [Lachnospiraceae bacterium]|nr:class I SAM-dependent methyltransferase [Lachnospiraceae bacterium]